MGACKVHHREVFWILAADDTLEFLFTTNTVCLPSSPIVFYIGSLIFDEVLAALPSAMPIQASSSRQRTSWVAVKEVKASYNNKETLVFAMYQYRGDLT